MAIPTWGWSEVWSLQFPDYLQELLAQSDGVALATPYYAVERVGHKDDGQLIALHQFVMHQGIGCILAGDAKRHVGWQVWKILGLEPVGFLLVGEKEDNRASPLFQLRSYGSQVAKSVVGRFVVASNEAYHEVSSSSSL